MTNCDALHRAILDNPDCDTTRLVYADALEESGRRADVDRAAFIRGQIAERGSGGSWEPLLKRYSGKWLPKPMRAGYPFTTVAGNTVYVDTIGGHVGFSRGFINRVGIELPYESAQIDNAAKRFALHVQSLFASNPLEWISISFRDDPRVLVAEIDRVAVVGTDAVWWRIGWSKSTQANLRHDNMHPSYTMKNRAELGQLLPNWIVLAVREPAAAVRIDHTVDGVDLVTDQTFTIEDWLDDYIPGFDGVDEEMYRDQRREWEQSILRDIRENGYRG